MWNAVPYLGKAASAVLISIFICPVTVDLYWAPSLKGDLMHNWAIVASKNAKTHSKIGEWSPKILSVMKFPQLKHIFTDSYNSFKQSLDISDPALMNVNVINILPPVVGHVFNSLG